jgi:hypothetical protein
MVLWRISRNRSYAIVHYWVAGKGKKLYMGLN